MTIEEAINLGLERQRAGSLRDAENIYRQILAGHPDQPDTLNLLADLLSQTERLSEAVEVYQAALRVRPDWAQTYGNLGVVYRRLGQLDAAIAAFRQAINRCPDSAPLYSNLGFLLGEMENYDQAIAALKTAISLQPDHTSSHYNLAHVYTASGELDAAIREFRQILRIRPGDVPAQWGLAMLHLKRGEFEEGWPLFESRNAPGSEPTRRFTQPRWNGGNAAGATILLHAEGGYGDTIQYVRYAPMVRRFAGRVLLECRAELAALLASVAGVDQVIPRDHALPAFDLQVPLLSLPLTFKTGLDAIPNHVPYLAAPDSRLAAWQQRVVPDGRRNIGICWAGHSKSGKRDTRRCDLQLLAPFFRLPGIRFFSLQVGEAPAGAPDGWIDFTADLHDFADTAALIQHLDLVITVDTAVAHLAGALARPLWLLTPFNAAYQWLLKRTDSPWYPTMRLFRQKKPGDWTAPIEQMTAALTDWINQPA